MLGRERGGRGTTGNPSFIKSIHDVCQLAFKHDVAVPAVAHLAKRLLTSPVSTVDVDSRERFQPGFIVEN